MKRIKFYEFNLFDNMMNKIFKSLSKYFVPINGQDTKYLPHGV